MPITRNLGAQLNGFSAQWSRIGLIIGLLLAHFSFVPQKAIRSLAPIQLAHKPSKPKTNGPSGLTKNDIFRAIWANEEWSHQLTPEQLKAGMRLSQQQAELRDELITSQLAFQMRMAEVWNAQQ